MTSPGFSLIGSGPEERVLWKGQPDHIPRTIVSAFFIIGLLYLAITWQIASGVKYAETGLLIPSLFLIFNLFILLGLRGRNYTITTRRVATQHNLLFAKSGDEIFLASLAGIHVKRFLGIKNLEFKTFDGRKLTFRFLKDDPLKLRNIALDAKHVT